MTETLRYADKPWLKKYEADVPATVNYETECLPVFLDRSAAEFPDQMALLFQGYKVS